MPPCILQRIEEIKSEGVWSPAATVWKISTAGHGILYYIPDHCCDYYSELYDDQCHLFCAPEGGIGGGGTGDCPDYIEVKRELYWTDPRD